MEIIKFKLLEFCDERTGKPAFLYSNDLTFLRRLDDLLLEIMRLGSNSPNNEVKDDYKAS
jgi:hypothetical protein